MDVQTPAPTDHPGPPRFLKWSLPVLVAALLLALYFAPQLPAVRGWLLSQVDSAVPAGYSLDYSSSGGNLWSGIEFGGANVDGPGLAVEADKLSLGYSLPALLTGRLPVSVTAEGVRGRVALKNLTAGGSGRGSNAAPVRPVLRDLSLKDVNLRLVDVPYTLPDLNVTNLQARPTGDAFRAEATLKTAEGEAVVNGTLALNPLRFTADVPRLDARVARQWWRGITGGTLAGTVSYADGRLRADASLRDGSLDFLGETASGIQGDIAYENATVRADLTGAALGGEVTAAGSVDVAARRWSAEADSTVNLRDAALWLAAGRVPVDVSGIPLSGSARTRLSAAGWRDFTLDGAATGAGDVAGYALEDLQVDYSFDSDTGARVNATANLAGGDVTASLTPQADGFSFDFGGAGVQLSPAVTADLEVGLTRSPGGLVGTTEAALTGTLLDQALNVTLGGILGPDVVQASVDGTALGGPLTGAGSLQGGVVAARLELPGAVLPGLKRPVGLEFSATGPADALPLTFTLTTPEPTGLVLGPLTIPKDIGGQASATLRGTRLEDLSGRFGTLTVAGDLDPDASGNLTYSLANTPLSGVVQGEASVDGVLTLADGVLESKATVTSSALRLANLTLPPLDAAELEVRRADTWTATLTAPDETFKLGYDGGDDGAPLRVTTADYPVTVAGQALILTGTGKLAAADPLGSLDLALNTQTPFGDVTLTGGAAALRYTLETPTLGPDAQLTGTANLLERTTSLSGRLGALDVAGTGRWDDGLDGTLTVEGGGEGLELRVRGRPAQASLALTGRLPLNLVGDLFGVTASGTVNADLVRTGSLYQEGRYQDGRYQGSAEVAGTLASVPVALRFLGEGDSLGVTGDVTPFAVPLSLSGRLLPTVELNGASELGRVALVETGLTGAGTVPGGTFAGFTLEPQPWTLAGDLAAGTATLSLPETASSVRVDRGAAGWRATLDLAQTLARGDSAVSVETSGILAAGSTVRGEVRLQTPAGDATLPLTGSLEGLELSGTLPAPVAASLVGAPVAVTGDLEVAARARVGGGLTYAATAAWQTPRSTLTAQLDGAGTNFNVTAAGGGLELSYGPDGLSVQADGFQLEPFLSAAGVQGSLNGSLRRTLTLNRNGAGEGEAGWDGTLTLAVRTPAPLQAALSGAGERLELSTDYGSDALGARAVGTLLPTLDLALSGAFRDLATLQGRVGGTLTRPAVAATLTTKPLDVQGGLELTVPAQTLTLTADFGNGLNAPGLNAPGLNATLRGDALELDLFNGVLRGGLRLPFTVAGAEEVLSAEVGGTLSHPSLDGTLVGNIASGPVRVADGRLTTTLNLRPSPLLGGLPLDAPALTVAFTGAFEGARDLTWQAQVEGSAQLQGLPLALGGTLSGEGASYRGTVSATLAGESVPLTVAGQGGAVQVQANLEAFSLASLAPALPIPVTGTLGGTLDLDTRAPQPLSFDLTASGAVRGRGFDLTAERTEGELSVTGDVAGAPFKLGDETGAYSFTLGSSTDPLSLAGRLELAPALRLDVSGQYLSQPLTATAAYATSDVSSGTATPDTATWSAAVGDATVSGDARRVGGVWTLQSVVNSPADGVLPFQGGAEVAARVENGNVTLDTLTANTAFGGRAVGLELSGPAWPAPGLTGGLAVAGFGRGDLTLSGAARGYDVALNYDGLALNAALTPGLAVETVTLSGAGKVPVGGGVPLTSDLTWTAAGFSGKAGADLSFGDLTANLTAVGTGPLGVAGRATYRGRGESQEVARLELALSADPFARPGLNGHLALQGDIGRFLPAYRTLTATPTTLTGRLDVSGEVTRPRVSGPVALQGALAAAGAFVWDGGAGRIELSGDGLDATAALRASGWSVAARADGLDLTPLLPQLDAPRLGAMVTGSGSWGEPVLQVDGLTLQTPNGSLAGDLTYDGALSGRLETDFALGDLNLGPALRGRLTGDLLLTGNSGGSDLTGTLQAVSLGLDEQSATLDEQPAVLDGTLVVRGTLAAPDLNLNLRGAGTASGTLSGRFAPSQGSYALTSTLTLGDLRSDFAVSLNAASPDGVKPTDGVRLSDGAKLGASGELAYRDYAVTLRGAAAGGDLTLTGRDRLEGWHLDLVPAAARLEVRGPLAGLADALAGNLALSAAWPPADGWLGGGVSGLAVGPLQVGDVALASSGARTLTLAGDRLAATVALRGGVAWSGFTWDVARLDAELPGDLAIRAAGRGTLTSADLSTVVSAQVQGESLQVPADLSYNRGTVTLTSDADALGGHVFLNARGSAAAGWQGELAVEAVSLSGVTASLEGTLSGAWQTPELAAALRVSPAASPATVFSGTVTAARASLSLSGDLTSPLLEESLNLAGTFAAEPALTLQKPDGETLTLGTQDGLLTATGALELAAGPVRARLAALPDAAAGEAGLALTLDVPSLAGLTLESALPRVAPADLPEVLSGGVVFRGGQTLDGAGGDTGNTGGSVVVNVAGASADVRALSFATPDGRLELSGTVAPRTSRLSGRWQGAASASATLPWLASLTDLSFETELTGAELKASATGNGSHLDARYSLETRNGALDAALDLPTGSARAALVYDAARGPSGSLAFADFPLFSGPTTGDAHLGAVLTLTPEALSGTADLELAGGNLTLNGSLGLASVLPSAVAPLGANSQDVTARLTDFGVENVPWAARVLPYVSAPLTGTAALRGGKLSGRLTAPVTVTEETLPLTLTLGGAFGAVEAEGTLGRSTFKLSRSGGTVAGLVRFVDFPLDEAVAAVAGPREVSAQLTGALRFEVPGGVLEQSYIRFSSERFVLEEGGVSTQGDLSFDLENGALTVQKASFEGVGSWQASGVASRNRLDLRFDAQDADFSPLLRLVPQLAGLNVGAFGSVQLVTSGSLVNPVVRASSSELEVRLGGSAYRLLDTGLTVQNSDFVTSGRLDGVAPLTGSLAFTGGGQVKLAAPRRFDLGLRFAGNPEVPVLGTLESVEGTVSVRPGEPWQIATTGVLGNPFELSGSLSPLDLRLTGEGLNLRAPQFFLASSLTDADLRFFRADGYHLAGALQVRQAELDLESRKTAATPPGASANETPGDETPPVDETPGDEAASSPRARSPFLSRLTFDDLSLRAPQQISFAENFGSGELGNVDLVLSGTAAQPRLSGAAQGLRGTVRFAGRDFALEKALATFEPAQGLYPTLDIAATTRFDKLQVLAGLADRVSFVEPRSGSDFNVTLSLTGGVVPNPAPDPDAPKPFKVDVTPSLSSDAVIEVSGARGGEASGENLAAGTRPLSEPELFSLLTLGKLELSPEFARGGLATSLAQGALDTAVDFLILSELQRGLGDALGLELLEIRTTPLGSLLTGDNEAFGVSLRLGGYLSDEVFASYEVGSLGVGADVSLRNQFDVRYSLGALEFSLAGKLDLYRDASLEPLPEIDLNLAYAFSPLVRLETGIDLSTAKQGVRFGVSLRW